MDLKLNSDGDLDLSTGDVEILSGIDEARQRVQIKLRFFKGEWFLAPTFGVPWFQQILGKNRDTDVVRNTLVRAVATEPGVDKVTELVLEYDPTTRQVTIPRLQAIIDGEFTDFADFVPVEI